MLNKIDKKLLTCIRALKNKDIEIIVHSKNKNSTKMMLQKYTDEEIIELPLISCFVIKTSFRNIFKIARCKNVTYISSNSKVCSLIYNSKLFINYENIESFKLNKPKHSCVVIDTGIYPHIDFVLGRNRIIKFVDLINNKQKFYDDNGHGTFVCGVLSSNSIINKYKGIDNDANIIVIKALDNNGETSSVKILQAMQWVSNNAKKYNIKVVCMSFGSASVDINDPLIYGAETLWNKGIVVVCAAGNNGPNSKTIMSPGVSKKIITVGSLDNINGNLKVADFSSRGPAFHYYKPDVVVPGTDIISTNIFSSKRHFYTMMSGTSVSTPIVAGIASLLFNYNINYTPDQIKYMIINSCVKITGDYNSEGFGRVDLSKLKLL